MSTIFELNEAQAEAVMATEDLLCCCGPGSGKSRVLIERTVRVLQTFDDPYIVLITYTKHAANELRDRLKRRLRPDQLARVTSGTFHSIALGQLVRAKSAGRVLSDADTANYVFRALHQTGVDVEFENALSLITLCKTDKTAFADQPEIIELTDAYCDLMRKDGVIDFTDMMVRAVSLMRATKGSNRIPPLRATHIMVDEFQDIDRPQLEWLYCHMDATCNITGVGDDDQSIFSFRLGLGYKGMMEFANMAGARIINLDTNYRSSSSILDYAGRLIAHNKERVPKTLFSSRGAGQEPILVLYAEREAEYEDMVSRIVKICRRNPPPRNVELKQPSKYLYTVLKGQIAILARTNFNLLPIERELIKAQIPCFRMGKKSIWEEHVVQVLTSLLTSLHNRESVGIETALRWLGVSETVLTDLRERFGNLHDFLDPDAAASKHSGEYGKHIADFSSSAAGWIRTLTNADDVNDAAQGVIYGASAWMLRVLDERKLNGGKGKKKDSRSTNLIESALELLDLVKGDLRQRLIRAKDDEEPNMPRVVLGTFHASKGLEFNACFLADCNQGLTPSKEAGASPEQLEEERRLMYVAETRAKDYLVVYADQANISQFVLESGFVLPDHASNSQAEVHTYKGSRK